MQRGNTQAHSALEYKRSAKRHKRDAYKNDVDSELPTWKLVHHGQCAGARVQGPDDCDTVPNCHSHKSCTGCVVSNAMLPGVCDHSVSCLGLSVGLVCGSVDYMAHTMWSSSVFFFSFPSRLVVRSALVGSLADFPSLSSKGTRSVSDFVRVLLGLDGSVQVPKDFARAVSSLPTALTLFSCLDGVLIYLISDCNASHRSWDVGSTFRFEHRRNTGRRGNLKDHFECVISLVEQPCQKPLCGPVFLTCILAARCRMLLGCSGDLHLVLSKLKRPVRFSRASGDGPPLPGDASCRKSEACRKVGNDALQ